MPELAIGLVIVSVCVLVALVWSRSLTATATVLVTAGPLERGDVIDDDDLVTAEVGAASHAALVAGDSSADLVGRIALVDVPAGTPVIDAMFGDQPVRSPDDVLVGVAIERGHAPSDLAVGDTVGIVVVADAVALDPAPARLMADPALVWAIEPADEFEPRAVVTLGVPIDVAADVAAAPGVRLVRVGP